jgi:hypothetical protein
LVFQNMFMREPYFHRSRLHVEDADGEEQAAESLVEEVLYSLNTIPSARSASRAGG